MPRDATYSLSDTSDRCCFCSRFTCISFGVSVCYPTVKISCWFVFICEDFDGQCFRVSFARSCTLEQYLYRYCYISICIYLSCVKSIFVYREQIWSVTFSVFEGLQGRAGEGEGRGIWLVLHDSERFYALGWLKAWPLYKKNVGPKSIVAPLLGRKLWMEKELLKTLVKSDFVGTIVHYSLENFEWKKKLILKFRQIYLRRNHCWVGKLWMKKNF